jgi:hypothetical protein
LPSKKSPAENLPTTAALKNKGGRIYFEQIVLNEQLEVNEAEEHKFPYFLKLLSVMRNSTDTPSTLKLSANN